MGSEEYSLSGYLRTPKRDPWQRSSSGLRSFLLAGTWFWRGEEPEQPKKRGLAICGQPLVVQWSNDAYETHSKKGARRPKQMVQTIANVKT